MTTIERQMEAFRTARDDTRTDAQRALDTAVEKIEAEIEQARKTESATVARMCGGGT